MANLYLDTVGKRYGRKTIFDAVTTHIPIGLTLLTGPSGAGKSTLLRILATAERSGHGRLIWKGALLPAACTALRRTLGYAPQAVDLPDDPTAREFAMQAPTMISRSALATSSRAGCRFTPSVRSVLRAMLHRVSRGSPSRSL